MIVSRHMTGKLGTPSASSTTLRLGLGHDDPSVTRVRAPRNVRPHKDRRTSYPIYARVGGPMDDTRSGSKEGVCRGAPLRRSSGVVRPTTRAAVCPEPSWRGPFLSGRSGSTSLAPSGRIAPRCRGFIRAVPRPGTSPAATGNCL